MSGIIQWYNSRKLLESHGIVRVHQFQLYAVFCVSTLVLRLLKFPTSQLFLYSYEALLLSDFF